MPAIVRLRFWVDVEGRVMGASVGRDALHHRYRPNAQGEDPLETFGQNSPLKLAHDRVAAAKTGTSDDYRDTWTFGFTPSLTARSTLSSNFT